MTNLIFMFLEIKMVAFHLFFLRLKKNFKKCNESYNVRMTFYISNQIFAVLVIRNISLLSGFKNECKSGSSFHPKLSLQVTRICWGFFFVQYQQDLYIFKEFKYYINRNEKPPIVHSNRKMTSLLFTTHFEKLRTLIFFQSALNLGSSQRALNNFFQSTCTLIWLILTHSEKKYVQSF